VNVMRCGRGAGRTTSSIARNAIKKVSLFRPPWRLSINAAGFGPVSLSARHRPTQNETHSRNGCHQDWRRLFIENAWCHFQSNRFLALSPGIFEIFYFSFRWVFKLRKRFFVGRNLCTGDVEFPALLTHCSRQKLACSHAPPFLPPREKKNSSFPFLQ
jgi:hypothetical protein